MSKEQESEMAQINFSESKEKLHEVIQEPQITKETPKEMFTSKDEESDKEELSSSLSFSTLGVTPGPAFELESVSPQLKQSPSLSSEETETKEKKESDTLISQSEKKNAIFPDSALDHVTLSGGNGSIFF